MEYRRHTFRVAVLAFGLSFGVTGCGFISTDDIFHASEKGNVSRVKALLKDHPELINATDSYTQGTPLVWAATPGKAEVVKLLIEKGANLNAKTSHGDTALHVSAEYSKSVETVRLLVKAGADVNAKDEHGCTPLFVVTDGIRAISMGLHPKGEAALGDSRVIAELLVEAGANVNAANNGGGTPLNWSAGNANPLVAQLLISKGANVNAVDEDGQTPLHTCSFVGGVHHVIARGSQLAECQEADMIPVIELLLASGADINRRDAQGKTALALAIKMKKNTVAQFLRDHGAKE